MPSADVPAGSSRSVLHRCREPERPPLRPPRHLLARPHECSAGERGGRWSPPDFPAGCVPGDPNLQAGTSMLTQAVRELRRHAVRSLLTAVGIAVGVTALVLLGALSEKTSRLLEGGRDFGAGQITVSGTGGDLGTGMLRGALVSGEQLAALHGVSGVEAVAPIVMFPISETPGLPFTLAPLAFGVDSELLTLNRRSPRPMVRVGRSVPGEGEVVIGHQVARHLHADIGSTITIRGHDFQVVGILEPTLTGPDSFVMMPFPTAERLLVETEPVLK